MRIKQAGALLLGCILVMGQLLAQCTDDCVWPGDMNANGTANNLDILELGFALDAMGPARSGASTDWSAQTTDNWTTSLPSGLNVKHVDADGNGRVEDVDRIVTTLNYNKFNEDFTGFLGYTLRGDDLFAVPLDTAAAPGGRLRFDIHLGTAANPVANLYGIGFRLLLDTQYVAAVNVSYEDSWIGQGEEVLNYDKYSDEIDHAGVAITRLDGRSASGHGPIARVEIIITDIVLGIEADTTACLPFPIDFAYVLGLDTAGQELIFRSQGDTLMLKHPSQLTSLEHTAATGEPGLLVYPNPTDGNLWCRWSGYPVGKGELRLYNAMGQLQVYRTPNEQVTQLSLAHLPRGIYYLEWRDHLQRQLQKILLE